MRNPILLGAILVLALILAACGPAATPAPADTVVPTTAPTDTEVATEAPTEPAATESPVATDTQAAAESPTAAGVPVTGAATVSVSDSADFGSFLVDAQGRSLYFFMNDTENSGTSACTGDCAVEWPPLLTDGDPVAGEGIDASLLGTITRDDGTTQVTYNGRPLYLFEEDAAAGDTNGQALEDEFGQWFLVSPTGEAIQQ